MNKLVWGCTTKRQAIESLEEGLKELGLVKASEANRELCLGNKKIRLRERWNGKRVIPYLHDVTEVRSMRDEGAIGYRIARESLRVKIKNKEELVYQVKVYFFEQRTITPNYAEARPYKKR